MRVAVVAAMMVLLFAGVGCAVLSFTPEHMVEWEGSSADSVGGEYPVEVAVTYTIERQFFGGEYTDYLTGIVHVGALASHLVNITAESHNRVRYRIKTVLDFEETTVEDEASGRCETDWFWWLGIFRGDCEVKK